ncbi:MAG TPA: CopG family transcriptional regulator [Gemmatimonadales bacterium]|nr:CopG family transcriptional regulator [Gemmatimonadales bacterium]
MTKASKFGRISITLPRELLVAADRRARELDRARSWIVAEALRRYVGAGGAESGQRVSEPTPPSYAAEAVKEARRRHLIADLALSPTERLRRAEELLRLAWRVHGRRRRPQVIGFDSYEDFYEWKKKAPRGGERLPS